MGGLYGCLGIDKNRERHSEYKIVAKKKNIFRIFSDPLEILPKNHLLIFSLKTIDFSKTSYIYKSCILLSCTYWYITHYYKTNRVEDIRQNI